MDSEKRVLSPTAAHYDADARCKTDSELLNALEWAEGDAKRAYEREIQERKRDRK